jgi:hypothetical protein
MKTIGLAITAATAFLLPGAQETGELLRDPGFEAVPAGVLPTTGPGEGWEVQRHGRDVIQNRLVVSCVDEPAKAKSGRKSLSLSIPKDTVGFEFVTVGQRHRIPAGVEVEASVWVRWTGGPETAPPGASATSGHPSAIVSFWARHRDGTGDFAGRDEWLFDDRWTRLSFRFRASDPGEPTLVYVSLLPNQKPADTTVAVDDFSLRTFDEPAETEPREGELVKDPGFKSQKAGSVSAPWFYAGIGGTGIPGVVVEDGDARRLRMSMGRNTSNFESAQLWQHLDLREGVRYDVSAKLRWDNFAAEAPAPIVNYGIFHEASRTWYGPVDQVLEKTSEWRTYRFAHVPPFGGTWKLYVQLNGWGNFGNGVGVSIAEISCTPSRR